MLLTQRKTWKKLCDHAELVKSQLKKEMHDTEIVSDSILLDYRAQRVDTETFDLLYELADECSLREKIEAMMTGMPINQSERRPALHTALRTFDPELSLMVNDQNIMPMILNAREQMAWISNQLRAGERLGYTGQPITDIVNIGIGGSHLGPRFCLDAFTDQVTNDLRFHFLSDMDSNAFRRTTRNLRPETTLFIVSSKSFTTQETLDNARRAISWVEPLLREKFIEKHFIAVTAYPEKAKAFGIKTIVPIWEWIGGRFSICSAINLITCIAIGYEQFCEFLMGAHRMDVHFRQNEWQYNLPVVLALLGIWNNNFLYIHQHLMLMYAQSLRDFVPFIQQMDMESNGKSLNHQGQSVNYATGPLVWGGLGDHVQHSYYQLLCQGTHHISADLISIDLFNQEKINYLCLAHKKILSEGFLDEKNPAGMILSNLAVNHIRLKDLSPRTIGALVALYEHKIFVQGVIWDINSFDQPAVESSKQWVRSRETIK